jgi:hypothetical protein
MSLFESPSARAKTISRSRLVSEFIVSTVLTEFFSSAENGQMGVTNFTGISLDIGIDRFGHFVGFKMIVDAGLVNCRPVSGRRADP